MEYDVFISHASEDKDAVVRPLAARLEELGVKVWLDEYQLKLGDSLRRSIERGLRQSKFGVVVVSQNFIKKEWTQRELGLLISKEEKSRKVILPIWHNITEKEVKKFSPSLVDKFGISSEKGVEHIAQQVYSVVKEATSLETAAVNIAAQNETSVETPKKTVSNEKGVFVKYLGFTPLEFLGIVVFSVVVTSLGVMGLSYFFPEEKTFENPGEVLLQGCEFGRSQISCTVFNGFRDKRITGIEVEVKLNTPIGNEILRPQLPLRYVFDGQPLQSSEYIANWSYYSGDSSINSKNIKVTTQYTTPVR